jgi:hypothetical protein
VRALNRSIVLRSSYFSLTGAVVVWLFRVDHPQTGKYVAFNQIMMLYQKICKVLTNFTAPNRSTAAEFIHSLYPQAA